MYLAGFWPRATRSFGFGKRDCPKSSLAAFSLLKALNVLTVRLGLFAACGLARKLFEQSLEAPKTILACARPCGFPAMLADSGGCATRFEVQGHLSAQTVLAESPESAPLLGHARRREAKYLGKKK